ncbi:MAG: hypothetical protein NVS9B1_06840 [Candidatus Dormibacteraceae bacterium]
MRVYTVVQLGEIALFAAVMIYALLATPDRHPSLALAAGGLLVGKAVLNVLAPEGGSVIRRSIIGYSVGALFAAAGIALLHA